MLAGTNTGALAFWGLALQDFPQTSHALEPREDMSSTPAENGFSVIWSPQIASDDSKCFTGVLKKYGTPSPKSGGTGTLRLC